MALSQQQRDAFDKALGIKTVTGPVTSSRAQELKNIAQNPSSVNGFTQQPQQNIFQKVGGDIKNTFQETADKYGQGKVNFGETMLRGTGAIAKGANDIVGAGIEAIPGVKNVEAGVGSVIGAAHNVAMKDEAYRSVVSDITNAAKQYQDWATKNPELAKDVGAVSDIANAALTFAGGEVGGAGAKEAAQSGIVKGVGEKVASGVQKLGDRKVLSPEGVVGKIVQSGEKKEIGNATSTLSHIKPEDISKIKTFEDLGKTIDEGNQTALKEIDKKLLENPNSYKTTDFIKYEPSPIAGNPAVKTDYLGTALRDLDEVYDKTNKASDRIRIQGLINKSETQGLNAKEINDIAKEYGTQGNAFNMSGDLKLSTNAQASEVTRKGVKDVARSLMPDDTTKLLDEQINRGITTKKMVDEMAIKVQQAKNKIKDLGIGGKVLTKAIDLIDTLSLGSVKGLAKAAASKAGLLQTESMSSIEIEKALQKNLIQLDKINKTNPEQLRKLFNQGVK